MIEAEKLPECTHVSREMLEYYGRTGLCGICIHAAYKKLLEAHQKNLGQGETMIGSLKATAHIQRLLNLIQKYARCPKCATPILESKRHGCVECRGDRSWLTKSTRKEKKK